MPEVTDNSLLKIPIAEYPYTEPLEQMMKLNPAQIRERVTRGRDIYIAKLGKEGKSEWIPRTREVFNIIYNVYLIDPNLLPKNLEDATDEEVEETVFAAQIGHKIAHHLLYAKSGQASQGRVNSMSNVAKTIELMGMRKWATDADKQIPQRWTAIKAETAAIGTFAQEGWTIHIPDHQQPFDLKKRKENETHEMDLIAKTDAMVIVPSQIGNIAFNMDFKGGSSYGQGMSMELKKFDHAWDNLTIRKLMEKYNAVESVAVVLSLGPDCYQFYNRRTDDISKFAELKPEVKSALIERTGHIIRDIFEV